MQASESRAAGAQRPEQKGQLFKQASESIVLAQTAAECASVKKGLPFEAQENAEDSLLVREKFQKAGEDLTLDCESFQKPIQDSLLVCEKSKKQSEDSLLPQDVRERIDANRQAAIQRRAERLRWQVEGGEESRDHGHYHHQQQQLQQQQQPQPQQPQPQQKPQQPQPQHQQGPVAPLQVSLELVSTEEFCLFADWDTSGAAYKELGQSGGSTWQQRHQGASPVWCLCSLFASTHPSYSPFAPSLPSMPHNRFNPVHEINNQTRPVLFYPSLPNRPPLLSLQIRPIRWQHVATEASRGVTRLVPVFPLRLYDSLLFSLRAIPPFHASQPLRPNQQPDQSCVPVSTLGALKERKERERMRGMVEAAAGAAAAAADLGKRGVAEAEVTAGETIKAETGGAATAGGGAAASAAAGVGGSGSAAEESTHVSPFLNLACPTSDPAAGSGQGGSGRGGSARSALDREMEQRLPIQLQRALLPFQREGVAFAVGRGGRCLIADEMGVGKTIQAIAAAAWYMAEGPLLIVCPACLRLQWAEQLERWLPFLRPSQIHIVFGQRDDLVEEDQGERAVGASTDGHLNELTDKAKST
ncbi:unnamed protein product, partial [Closterium sp. NIES-54]